MLIRLAQCNSEILIDDAVDILITFCALEP